MIKVEQDQILYALRTTIKLTVYRSRGCLADENCYSDGKRIGGLWRSDLENGTGTALQQLRARSTGPFLVPFCSEGEEKHGLQVLKQ